VALPALPKAPLKWIGTVWDLARKVHNLLEAQEKASTAIAALDDEVQALKVEIARLKAREEVLIARAEAASAVAASGVAVQSMADLARRIGTLEARQTPGQSLPPPNSQDRPTA
jgi:phage shock protein A